MDENADLEAYMYIPTEKAADIRMGLPVQIVTSTGELIENTKIYFISQQVDNATQGILVKAPVHGSLDKFRNAQLVKARAPFLRIDQSRLDLSGGKGEPGGGLPGAIGAPRILHAREQQAGIGLQRGGHCGNRSADSGPRAASSLALASATSSAPASREAARSAGAAFSA